jgi:hypothetical protein
MRIEPEAFSFSPLESIVIPQSVQYVDGSALICMNLSSTSIESGNDVFVIEKNFLMDVLGQKLIQNFSQSSAIEIGIILKFFGSKSFSYCKSVSSMTFESNSCLTRIESEVFSSSSLQSILIPRNVEILGSGCFSRCKSLSSITFESNSHLTRIESDAFSSSSLQSILIPRNVQFVDGSVFINVTLSSISFESDSRLTRIESEAFSWSSLQSIIIPRNVQFIDGSAFICVTLSSISIESGNNIFVIENDILIDVLHHKLIRNFSKSSATEIARTIEVLGSNCFSYCKSLSSITFESNSHLTRIELEAFYDSSLQSTVIPRNVQFIDGYAFSDVILSSFSIESGNDIFVVEKDFLIDVLDHKLNLKENDFQIEDGVDSVEVSAFVSWVEPAEYADE